MTVLKELASWAIHPLHAWNVATWVHAAGVAYPTPRLVAAAAATCATYDLDHINESSFYGARFGMRAQIALSLSVVFVLGVLDPAIFALQALFVALALFYDRPVPGTTWTVKNAFVCSKTLFVPAMHVGFNFAMAGSWPASHSVACMMFVHYVFLNVLMDLKDEKEDAARGVRTLPVLLGGPATVRLVAAAQASVAALAWWAGLPRHLVVAEVAECLFLSVRSRWPGPPNECMWMHMASLRLAQWVA